jgi:hypothetical protein
MCRITVFFAPLTGGAYNRDHYSHIFYVNSLLMKLQEQKRRSNDFC